MSKTSYITPPRINSRNIRYWHIPSLRTEGNGKFTWKLKNELKEALIKNTII
jgi:hypothetical protein